MNKKIVEIEREYWNLEINLAKIADSVKLSRKELIKEFPILNMQLRNEIQNILVMQMHCIGQVKNLVKLERKALISNSIIDLSCYRAVEARIQAMGKYYE